MRNLNRLAGRRAIVTGGANGIGAAIAKLFIDEGCKVLVVDTDENGFRRRFSDHLPQFIQADVADPDSPKKIVAAAVAGLGGIDILVNQVGIGIYVPLDRMSDDQWQRTLDVNVTSMFRLSREVIPHLKANAAGRIINTSSIMGVIGDNLMGAYSTSKHAIVGLTKNLAIELAPSGITANYILPGPVITESARAAFDQMPDYEAFWVKRTPLGRLAMPEDVAYAVLFLASDEARYITGSGLRIDGGILIRP
jgi:NAD(P)-dependent dehydrogenase (short-subunit alcohol dehydrogenase family)